MLRTKNFVIGATLLLTVACAFVAWPTPIRPINGPVERIVVEKQKHLMTIYGHGHSLIQYHIALGHGGLAPKRREGDGLTPEGRYVIDAHKAASAFHKALHISYPSPADRAAALARGVDPGGAIMVHGMRNGLGWISKLHTIIDWTNGCIAITDREIDQLWTAVPNGTPIEIRP